MDTAWVIASFSNASYTMDYGVPLSAEEKADLDARMAVQLALDPMVAYLTSQADVFGGIYIDQLNHGQVVIGLTVLDQAIEANAEALAPAGASLRFWLAPLPLQVLEELQDEVTTAMPALQAGGASAFSTWIDPKVGAVYVGVEVTDVATIAAIRARFGDRVEVVQVDAPSTTSCTRTNCGSPMKGGLAILSTNGVHCTSAFNGRSAGSSRYVVTAGHCLKLSGLGTAWTHHGTSFGTAAFHSYYTDSQADSGAISYSGSGPWNLVYASSGNDVRGMTAKASNASQPVGGGVCVSDGWNNYWHCGTIITANYTTTVGGVRLTHQWQVSFGVSEKGSGSPMLYLHTLFGILSGSTATNAIYSTVDGLWNELAVRPCLDASCT